MDGGEDWRQPAWTPGMRFDYVSDDDWVVSDDDDDDKSSDSLLHASSQDDHDLGFDDMTAEEDKSPFLKRLVNLGDTEKVVPLIQFVPVKPTSPHRFVVSIILSLGEFETEAEAWIANSMRGIFENCGLVPKNATNLTPCIYRILNRYIVEQLFFIPKTSKTFCYYVVAAFNVLRSALLFDEIHHDEMPPCLVSHLKVKVTEKYETFKNGMREGLVSVFSRKVKGVIIPGKEALLNTTKWHPLDWDPVVGRCF
jgi:hypothetical protein